MKSGLNALLTLEVTAAFSPVTKADGDEERHHRRHHRSQYDHDHDYRHHHKGNGSHHDQDSDHSSEMPKKTAAVVQDKFIQTVGHL